VPIRPSVAIYALAVVVLFVLPLSLAILLMSGMRDPRLFHFAYVAITSLTSIGGLAMAGSLWSRNRAMAHGWLMIAASAAFTAWSIYAPDLQLPLASCALAAVMVGLALMYRPLSSLFRQRRGGA
jgi:hypothetical protein